MRKNIFLVIISFIFLPQWVWAMPIECPYTIAVTELVTAKDGWSGYKVNASKTLKSSSIFEGEFGNTSQELAPEEKQQGSQLLQVWQLSPNNKYWLKCDYFETLVNISRILPVTIKTCSVKFELDKNNNIAKQGKLICQ